MKSKYKKAMLIGAVCSLTAACATTQDVERLEAKIDMLLVAQQDRTAIEEIFGQQSAEILQQLKTLDTQQVGRFNSLQNSYQEGNLTLVDVRKKMLNVLGNSNRIVTAQTGIYVRDDAGKKLNAISKGTKIVEARLLSDEEIPNQISKSGRLSRYSWGMGTLEDKSVIFPWELTMSTFAKEIVENTAKRTAEEFIRMGGGKEWNRPVYIDLTVQNDNQMDLSVQDNGEEVHINTNVVQ